MPSIYQYVHCAHTMTFRQDHERVDLDCFKVVRKVNC
jgi:hypothetical protein